MDSSNNIVRCFKKIPYEKIKELPMVKRFISDIDNQNLFENTFFNCDIENLEKLDLAFKKFYKKQKAIGYALGIIKRYSIDYDKRVRKRNKRYLLTLDTPIISTDYSSVSNFSEMIQDSSINFSIEMKSEIFEIENKQLIQAIKRSSLKPFQKQLLKLIYKENYSQREVSKIFGQTEQNIYYWHKKTIRQLKKEFPVNL